MPEECVFDHLSNNARRFHEFHRKWHVAYFHIERDRLAADAIQSAKAAKRDSWWQSIAAFRFAREIERQMLETGERV
jgi:hypothetical protein